MAIPMAARETSPSGETRNVSIINIDCINNAFKASGQARDRFFLYRLGRHGRPFGVVTSATSKQAVAAKRWPCPILSPLEQSQIHVDSSTVDDLSQFLVFVVKQCMRRDASLVSIPCHNGIVNRAMFFNTESTAFS